ncbi:zinc-ribbon domain-containing protein [Nocardia sp. NPDC051030]|uniref:zinc-ribbon domain-containing protein n=1 Tax=Nocardia sp. NPDC051030 TaxID=3155162 RepID=UPI00341EBABE
MGATSDHPKPVGICSGYLVAGLGVSVLIFGFRRQLFTLATLTVYCGSCRHTSPHALRKFVTKFTLFFVPLFPMNTEQYLECPVCGVRSPVPPGDIPKLVAQANNIHVAPGELIRTQPRFAGAAWPDLP